MLNATIQYHLESFLEGNETVVRCLLNSTYVNDIITGADTEEEAFNLYTQSKDIFRQDSISVS